MIDRRDPLKDRAFAARVIDAVLREPRPTPTRALLTALRHGSINDAVSAVWVAWHLATVRGGPIAPSVRARSLALVLGVVLALGVGSLVGAATLQVVANVATNGIDAGQQGVDEQGPTENTSPDGQEGVDGQQEGVDGQQEGVDGQTGTDEPGGDDGQSNLNEPKATDSTVDTDQSEGVDGQLNANEPDRNAGQSGATGQSDSAEQESSDLTKAASQPASDPGQSGTDQNAGNDDAVPDKGSASDQSAGDQPGADQSGGTDGGSSDS